MDKTVMITWASIPLPVDEVSRPDVSCFFHSHYRLLQVMPPPVFGSVAAGKIAAMLSYSGRGGTQTQ
jgi:hypothetical protein